ncbi:protein-disulfide reductase DsbD family protein [Azohydromonas aeria]|uniref:protein-disulfide reductase DsbD family protein n=1 Tax=Azohydromonas aeria TaxID=2590212 RepID=UPI001E53EBE2|nr:thioredoxin family protein [Azohydromonas aeria]
MPAKNLRRIAAFSLLLAPLLNATAQTEVRTEQLRAELLAHAPEGVAAGKPLWLGLLLEHAPHWHTYWKNPGDSGLATRLQWSLPAGVDAGEIEWPVPQRLPVGPLVNYGYEGRVLLPVRVQVPAGFDSTSLSVQLQADWLACKEVCLPQTGRFTLQLPTRAATAAHGALFEEAQRRLPQALPGVAASARIDGFDLVLDVQGLPAPLQGQRLTFFPEQNGILDNAAPVQARWEGAAWRVSAPLSPEREATPARLDAVLADAQGGGVQIGFDVTGPWPAPGATPRRVPLESEAPAAAAPSSGTGSPAFGLALLLALGGGMLLNLMPCVFPVLSLKLLGFVAHHHRRERVAAALAYTAGVLLSFVALAALMLALRAGGQQLGWGFQLQSPAFVAALALLFTVIGLNLAGQFELRGVLPSSLAGLQLRHPLLDHGLTGVLAVVVASPCTAPFMGASLGAAATLPAAQALAVFAALGLGMALPYLGVAAWPGLARALPRPGPWMAQLRTLLAFPIFATVVWLLWVLGQQTGLDGAVALLGLLVALAFALWALASPAFARARRGARLGISALAVAVLALTLRWALPAWQEAPATAAGPVAAATGDWEAWSSERVSALQAQGRPVFVDFTAAWCVTCQINKRGTLADATLRADFELRGVALLRADWTRRDAAIGAELARLGRSGVPVYALYPPGGGAPRLLTELLSVSEVRAALAALPPKPDSATPGPAAAPAPTAARS